MNNVVLVGRLTRDPELKYIPGSGTPVASFTIAIDRDYKNKDGSTTTDFIPVEIMGKSAEFAANYISKGTLVGVQGSIRVDKYETPNGEKRSFTKVAGMYVQKLEKRGDNEGSNGGSTGSDQAQYSAVEDDDVPF
ncbi:single-stranded DNA-binding protein [Peptostreptococcus faecalis]|uniref:single-stranded DNA-binding protein n=1 Tax=Peptostreptococcus faecalis TaxID=2045015 RepID=UPI000C7B489B|nr:single-stranded DNA-binding protein [Peptostreptococcus faecalis]